MAPLGSRVHLLVKKYNDQINREFAGPKLQDLLILITIFRQKENTLRTPKDGIFHKLKFFRAINIEKYREINQRV